MSMTIKKCSFCGKNFTAYGNTKYCNDKCKEQAKKEKLAQWKAKTNYTEKQRDKRRIIKTEELEKKRQQIKKNAEQEAKKRAKKEADFIKKATQQRKRAAKNGDLFERMEIIADEKGQLCQEYWKAYKEYALQELEESKGELIQIVNGIAIDSPNFEKEVLKSIKECGRIERNLIHKSTIKRSSEASNPE